jgi:hypothetical protein
MVILVTGAIPGELGPRMAEEGRVLAELKGSGLVGRLSARPGSPVSSPSSTQIA